MTSELAPLVASLRASEQVPLVHPLLCNHSHHLMWLPQTVFLCHFLVHYNLGCKTSLLQLEEGMLEHLCHLSVVPGPRSLPELQQTLTPTWGGERDPAAFLNTSAHPTWPRRVISIL